MAVSAMTGTVSWAPQNYKSTHGSYTAPTAWYKHKATLVDLAILDDTRLGQPEVGGNPVPTFPYKAGVLIGGGMTIQPRLESTLGWLLYGMMGDITTSQSGTSTVYTHEYTFDTVDPALNNWFSFRKHIPRKDNVATTDIGEIYTDCKVTSFAMTLPNDAPITTRIDVLGRTFELDEDPTAWTYTNTQFETYETIPVGCITGGYLKIDTVEYPIMAATVSFQNQPLDVRQERVFGDPYIEDITTIMRQLTFDVVVKWNDPDLYQEVLTGTTTGTQWTPDPFVGALDIFVQSPADIPTESTPYSLRIEAPVVMMAQAEGITLAGNQAILTRYTGTALDNTTNYVKFTLTNTTTEYVWPT